MLKNSFIVVVLISTFTNINSQTALLPPTLNNPPKEACVEIGEQPYENILFDWSKVAGATSYDVQFDNNIESFDTNEISIIPELFYPLISSGSSHFWKVRSRNASGVSDWSDQFRFFAYDTCDGYNFNSYDITLLQPENNSTVNDLSVNVNWNEKPNTTYYELFVSKNSDLSDLHWSGNIFDTSAVITDLDAGTKYYWMVRPNPQTTQDPSGQSEIWNFTTPGVTSNVNSIEKKEFTLYPNPAHDNITVRGLQTKTKYQITDLNGKICLVGVLSTQQSNIIITDLNSGMYFMELLGENTVTNRIKLIKK